MMVTNMDGGDREWRECLKWGRDCHQHVFLGWIGEYLPREEIRHIQGALCQSGPGDWFRHQARQAYTELVSGEYMFRVLSSAQRMQWKGCERNNMDEGPTLLLV